MELQIISAKRYATRLKATIHATGRLGFTDATAREMNLDTKTGVKFATDEENNLYLICTPTADEDCFKVYKSGGYYSLNTKPLFDELGYDYTQKTIMFDLTRTNEGENVYKMIKRIKEKRK